ncbi:hypothetical protein [Bacterioplanoides sp. SCSIO 12839]|uniref:hypothetical protein n=1 Tax=Bacterioplanoides sp. SCSIO 12839 TaxID=2829569 RepID=UPI0021030ACE|nr:hypothetical protein [Bacterioplanoides sp. SCSIO 12839]UTW47024.1 hypothetical protein KFF03_10520 [Bacterioplanoides sp. SCSIO 12839]
MIKRSAKFALGILLLIAGIIITPLPIPLGLISILMGLSLLISVAPPLRNWLILLRKRFTTVSQTLTRLRQHLPRFLQHVIDETDPDKTNTKW